MYLAIPLAVTLQAGFRNPGLQNRFLWYPSLGHVDLMNVWIGWSPSLGHGLAHIIHDGS
jgi:hypothetical protein